MRVNRQWDYGWFRAIIIFLLAGFSIEGKSSLAQVVPDTTLGNENSVVTPNVNVKGLPASLIEGGANRGANLFHSFSEFNIGNLERVYFANPTGIERIFSRITGNNISSIDGVLGVLGNADLFFLNPNGIIFGPNASLDVNGSFMASGSDRLLFENGFEFSGSKPEAPPLLTINMPIGLGFLDNQRAKVENAGNLTVGAQQRLTLVGNQVTSTGSLTAPGGTPAFLTNILIKARTLV